MTTQRRSMQDRRSGKDRRKFARLKQLLGEDLQNRAVERRKESERRTGWVRLTRWSSVCLEKLKLSKFLNLHNR
jgi:hypothetical protein